MTSGIACFHLVLRSLNIQNTMLTTCNIAVVMHISVNADLTYPTSLVTVTQYSKQMIKDNPIITGFIHCNRNPLFCNLLAHSGNAQAITNKHTKDILV